MNVDLSVFMSLHHPRERDTGASQKSRESRAMSSLR